MYCKNCGHLLGDNSKFCEYCGTKVNTVITPKPTTATKIQLPTTTPINNVAVKEEKEGHPLRVFIGLIIAVVLALAIAIGITTAVYTMKPNNDKDTIFSKEKPQVSVEETLTGLTFNVYCNTNYKKVNIKVTIFDINGKEITNQALTGYDYKKGMTYQLYYKTGSITELFDSYNYTYEITDYN